MSTKDPLAGSKLTPSQTWAWSYAGGQKPVMGDGDGKLEHVDSKGRILDPVRMMLQKGKQDKEASAAKEMAVKMATNRIEYQLKQKGLKESAMDSASMDDNEEYRKNMERQRARIMAGDAGENNSDSSSGDKKKKKKKDKKKKDKKKKDKKKSDKDKKAKKEKSKKRKREDSDDSDSDSD